MNKTILMAGSLFLTVACSHVRYNPEIPDRPGVIMDHGDLVFSVPPTHPQDKMKLSFREIKGDRLSLQMRFIRKGPFDEKNPETIDPKNLTLQVEGQGELLTPSEIRSATAGRPLIKLGKEPIQAIDVVYKLPLVKGETPEFNYFVLHWQFQYAVGKSEERSVRFDRRQKQLSSSVDSIDLDFAQYGEDGWYGNDSAWW